MNKRQAKKAFKKKYGVNPAQFDKVIDNLTPTVQNIEWEAIGRAMAETIQNGIKALNETIQNMVDYISSPEFQEALKQYNQEVKDESSR